MTDKPEILHYRNAMGVLQRDEFVVDEELPGVALSVRRVQQDNGRRLLQKFVPRHLGQQNAGYYDVLDREIRALTRLSQMFGQHYPVELARIIGYNTDVEEPYLLVAEYRGQPAELEYANFGEEQRRQFQVGLLRAVQHTSAAGVVHNALTMAALRWDGGHVQLVDFESAVRIGEPRRPGGRFPARSSEQAVGSGTAHVGDDMWGVGMVFRQLSLGPYYGDGYPDLGSERLRAQLDGLFAEPATARPGPEHMLQRIRAASALQPDPDLDELLRDGRQEFERASARKRGEPLPSGTTLPPGPGRTAEPTSGQPTEPRSRPTPPMGNRVVARPGAARPAVIVAGVVVTLLVIGLLWFLVTR